MTDTTAQTSVQEMINEITRQRINKANELRSRAQTLADEMTDLVARLDNQEEGTVNELGEVQRLGQEVDRLCAVVHEKVITERVLRRAFEGE